MSLDIEREKVRRETLPRINASLLLAPIYKVEGDVNSYKTDYNKWGVFLSSSIEGGIGVFFWGLKDKLSKAFSLSKEAVRYNKYAKLNEIVFEIKKYYYSYLASVYGEEFLNDVLKDIDGIIKKASVLYDEGKISKGDLERLKIKKLKALAMKEELLYYKKKALLGISFLTGISYDKLSLKKEEFSPLDISLKKLNFYLSLSKAHRPEYKGIDKALKSLFYVKEIDRISRYPVVFVGFRLEYAYTPVRTDQQNPFVNDPYNYLRGGAGIGVMWRFNYGDWNIREKEIEKRKREILMLKKKAFRGIPLEVMDSYFELLKSIKVLELSESMVRSSRRWFISSKQDYDLGMGDVKDLVKAYASYVDSQKVYIESILNNYISYFRLIKAIGNNVSIIKKYEKNKDHR